MPEQIVAAIESHVSQKTAQDLAASHTLDALRSLRQNITLSEGLDTPCYKIVDEAIMIKLREAAGT